MTGAAAAASGALLAGCGLASRDFALRASAPAGPDALNKLSKEEQWARTAWRYFENNLDAATGLAGGVDRSPVFTVWNAADMLAAIVCAHELGVIGRHEFDLRLSRVLGFLATMDLSQGLLPNKAYHAGSGKMVGFDGRLDDIGWSAVDIGRVLLWLQVVGRRHARFQEYVDRVVLRWNFCQVIDDCGTLSGTSRAQGQVNRYQEGRFGYEQLAAAGYAAWGFDVAAAGALPATQLTRIYGMPLAHDARDDRGGVQAPVLTMPYVLAGIELGFEGPGASALRENAQRVHALQAERWKREKLFTARTDYLMPGAPHVVLDAVFAKGYAWNTVANDGAEHERLALVATRAAFGLWALWPGEYADALIENVRWLYDADRGWFEGRFEAGGAPHAYVTAATNAAVLEALLYRKKGTLLPATVAPGPFRLQTADVFQRLNRCTPAERPMCRR